MTTLSNLFNNMALGFDYVKVSDVKAYDVAGGTFTSGDWRTRDINTEDSDASSICSIATNQITLQAGTYCCYISCPATRVTRHRIRLYNITDSVDMDLGGDSSYSDSAATGDLTWATIRGQFTISTQKTFEIQHYGDTTRADDGFGITSNLSGKDSVYTVAEFWRIKDLSEPFSEVGDYVCVSDHKAYNECGGTFTQDAWQTRDINTEESDTSNICSISSNQITLNAGTYICSIRCASYKVRDNIARLYNISDSEEVLLGTKGYGGSSGFDNEYSVVRGKFTISAQKTFEIQHRCSYTESSDGFGYFLTSIGTVDNIYTIAEFWRVAT